MTVKAFFTSDPGKAMIALAVTSLLIIYPVAAGWLAASYTLTYAVDKLRKAFQRLEAQEAAEHRRQLDDDERAADALRQLEAPAATPLRGNHAKIGTADSVAAGHDSRLPAGR